VDAFFEILVQISFGFFTKKIEMPFNKFSSHVGKFGMFSLELEFEFKIIFTSLQIWDV